MSDGNKQTRPCPPKKVCEKLLGKYAKTRTRLYFLSVVLYSSAGLVFLGNAVGNSKCSEGPCGEYLRYVMMKVEVLKPLVVAVECWGWIENVVYFWLWLVVIFIVLIRRLSTMVRRAEQEYAFQKWLRNAVFAKALTSPVPQVDACTRRMTRTAEWVAFITPQWLTLPILFGILLFILCILSFVVISSLVIPQSDNAACQCSFSIRLSNLLRDLL